jgi:DNA end-binding protein Ku
MAKLLVDTMTAEFEPDKYQDEYRQALLELIEEKVQGTEVVRPMPATGKITDLMTALKQSIEQAKKGRPAAEEAEEEEAETASAGRRRKRAG